MYFDLNLPINKPSSLVREHETTVRQLLSSCLADGYSGVAFTYNYSTTLGPKDKCDFKPYDLNALKASFSMSLSGPSTKSVSNFRQFTRLNLDINDNKQLQQLYQDSNEIINSYDVIAVRTRNEKIFHSLCIDTDTADIITFDYTEKLPFLLKRGPVTEAIKKGIHFEINYGDALDDMSKRRMILSNAILVANATKFKNIILSSGVKQPLLHRSPYDIALIAKLIGFKKNDAFACISKNCEAVLKRAAFRKNYKGVVNLATTEDLEYFEKARKQHKPEEEEKQNEGQKPEQHAIQEEKAGDEKQPEETKMNPE